MSYTRLNGMRSVRYPLQGLGKGGGGHGGGHHGGGHHGGGGHGHGFRRGGGFRRGWGGRGWGGSWGPGWYDDYYAYPYPVCLDPYGVPVPCPPVLAGTGMGCGCSPVSGLGCGSDANCSCRGATDGLGQAPAAPSWFGDTTSFAKGAAVAGTSGILLGLLGGWVLFHKG
jgi:hypothetical protein